MKKALFITSVMPDKMGAGRAKRAWMWLNLLKETYEVEMLLVLRSPAGPEFTDLQDIRTEQILRTSKNKLVSLWDLLSGRKSVYAIAVPGWFTLNNTHRVILESRYGTRDYEKIVCFRLSNAGLAVYLRSLTKNPQMELDMDDIESATWKSITQLYRRNGRYKEWLKTSLIAGQYERLEKRFIKYFEKIHVCSEEDRKILEQRFRDKTISVIPNKLSSITFAPIPCSGKNLLFTGSLSYYPNEEAVLWFAKYVLPQLRKADEQWSFHVVSFEPPKKLVSRLAKIEGLYLHQNIKFIEEFYAQSSIAVSPLRAGGGTKLKIIESMLYQRPVIATYESVRGLSLEQDIHYLAAETAQEFTGKILHLHENPELYRSLTRNALDHAKNKFCYDEIRL